MVDENTQVADENAVQAADQAQPMAEGAEGEAATALQEMETMLQSRLDTIGGQTLSSILVQRADRARTAFALGNYRGAISKARGVQAYIGR